MTKKLLSLITGSYLLIYSVSNAQPILTATGINPVIGDNFNNVSSNYISPGNSGANQTWDLSSLTYNPSANPENAVAASSTPYAANFPNANLAFTSMGNSYDYYKTSSTAFQNYGYSTSNSNILAYTDPEDILRFPFTYNNTYTDSWGGTNTNGGQTDIAHGTTTVTADAYGTLITPAGTFANVLRLHVIIDQIDSTNNTPTFILHEDLYEWYRNGIHNALAIAGSYSFGSGSPVPFSGYLANPSVGVNDIENMISEYTISPNPASEQLTLNFALTENKNVNVKVINVLGQNIQMEQAAKGLQGANSIELNVAKLPEGIYFAQILLDGNVAGTRRFVVSK
jgi:hypothetical protein